MKNLPTLVLASILYLPCYSQTPVSTELLGSYLDHHGARIIDYCDFDYVPEEPLELKFIIGKIFTPGCYYDLDNHKHTGFIKLEINNRAFKFKESTDSVFKEINCTGCRAFKVGRDSFTVLSNTNISLLISKEPVFAQTLDVVGHYTFYKYINNWFMDYYTYGIGSLPFIYFVKADTSNQYGKFTEMGFKRSMRNYTSGYPSLTKRLKEGEFDYFSTPEIVKLLKYKYLFDHHQDVFYDMNWDETEDSLQACYHSRIISVNDSIFQLKFYSQLGALLYEGYFTSFYPHRKFGLFSFYYPNGIVRKRILYRNNIPTNYEFYYPDGTLHYQYKFEDEKIYYTKVQNAVGQSLINGAGTGLEVFNDSINHRVIHYVYLKGALVQAYFQEDGKNIYQYCTQNAKVRKIKFENTDLPESSLRAYSHGLILVRCRIEPSGLISDLKIVQGLDSACNQMVLNKLKAGLSEKICIPGKLEDKEVTQEIILPIDINLEGFSFYRVNYYYYNWNPFYNNFYPNYNVPKFTPPTNFMR